MGEFRLKLKLINYCWWLWRKLAEYSKNQMRSTKKHFSFSFRYLNNGHISYLQIPGDKHWAYNWIIWASLAPIFRDKQTNTSITPPVEPLLPNWPSLIPPSAYFRQTIQNVCTHKYTLALSVYTQHLVGSAFCILELALEGITSSQIKCAKT